MNFVLRAVVVLTCSAMLFSCSDSDKSDEPVKSEGERPAALPESIVDGVCLSGISGFADIEYNEDATVKSMKFQDGTVEFEYGGGEARSANAGYPTGFRYTYVVRGGEPVKYILDVSDIHYNGNGFVIAYNVFTKVGIDVPAGENFSPFEEATRHTTNAYNADGQIVKAVSTAETRMYNQEGAHLYTLTSEETQESQYQEGKLMKSIVSSRVGSEASQITQIYEYEYDAVKYCANIYHTYYPEIAPYYVISQIFSCLGYLGLPSQSLPAREQITVYVGDNAHVANYQYEYTYGDAGQIVLLKGSDLTGGVDYTRTFKYAFF